MARRELSPAQLAVVQAVEPWTEEVARPIMVACSGGPDSMALALAVAHLASRGRAPGAYAVVIDHQLQDGSAVVAQRVVDQLARHGLPARVQRVRVEADPESGIEAAAREARYAGLAAAARPDTLIALGHTLDDQAETGPTKGYSRSGTTEPTHNAVASNQSGRQSFSGRTGT